MTVRGYVCFVTVRLSVTVCGCVCHLNIVVFLHCEYVLMYVSSGNVVTSLSRDCRWLCIFRDYSYASIP